MEKGKMKCKQIERGRREGGRVRQGRHNWMGSHISGSISKYCMLWD